MKLPAALLALMLPAAALAQGGRPAEVISSARVLRAIVPSDIVDLPLGPTRFLYNGSATACAITVLAADDPVAVTLPSVPSGAVLPLRAKRVLATGTVCTGIVGMW